MTPRRKKKALPVGCDYMKPGESRCGDLIAKFGHCSEHLSYAPEERALAVTLSSELHAAKQRLEDCGRSILTGLVFGKMEIPEEERREYRNLWHRHEHLKAIRDNRRPGDELPAEVTL